VGELIFSSRQLHANESSSSSISVLALGEPLGRESFTSSASYVREPKTPFRHYRSHLKSISSGSETRNGSRNCL